MAADEVAGAQADNNKPRINTNAKTTGTGRFIGMLLIGGDKQRIDVMQSGERHHTVSLRVRFLLVSFHHRTARGTHDQLGRQNDALGCGFRIINEFQQKLYGELS